MKAYISLVIGAALLAVSCAGGTTQATPGEISGDAAEPVRSATGSPAIATAAPTVAVAPSALSSPAAPTRQAPNPLPAGSVPPLPTPIVATSSAHVFVIVMENMSSAQAMAGPYIRYLSSTYAVATNYHGVGRPSLPNYLALTSGDTFGIQDDGYHALAPGGIGQQLTRAGVPWRAYMEGMTKGCTDSPYPYALKHNPFAYYGGGCPSNVVPLSQFSADLRSDAPRFVWITPDMCHDGHDCAVSQADAWLSGFVPMILASSAWRDGGILFVVWDEGDPSAANEMPLIAITAAQTSHQSQALYDHYSLLATIEDLLGLPRLGRAIGAATLTDLVPALTVKR